MNIKTLTVGDLATNCHLVTDEKTKQTLIIDPGDEADFISTTILENKLTPVSILLTHGHYDHCLGVLELKLNFNIPIYLHQADLFLYQKAESSAKFFSKTTIPKLPPIDHFLKDKEIVNFGDSNLTVLHTPGHTPGSSCFLANNHLFTGDTLFSGNRVGATNHSYSSKSDLQKSLTKLRSETHNLKSDIYIYPGHEDFGFTKSFTSKH